MVLPLPLRSSKRPDLYICGRCASEFLNVSKIPQRRWIGLKYLAKEAQAERDWDRKAETIRAGTQKSMLAILEERGLVQHITGSRENVDKILTDKRIGAYVGFDPTAPSLHVGHMLPLMSLFWMYVHGYHTVTLLGGSTAKIGDPTDRLKTRDKVHSSIRAENMVKMHYQLKKMWINVEAYGRKYDYNWEWAWKRGLATNSHWLNKLSVMEMLQILGLGVRVGSMLARDTVKKKLRQGDGMSFAEFTYPLLQAWDWWHMYITKGIQMQIGGSDQYGNITAGIEAVKYIAANHPDPSTRQKLDDKAVIPPFGVTVPLLTSSTGEKLGKSAGNAVWLDSSQTSPFELYAYFMGTPDADVEHYLKLFTFMPLEAIDALVAEHTQNPSLRKAQHKLASEFLELVHGVNVSAQTRQEHEKMFVKPPPITDPDSAKAIKAHSERPPGGWSLNTSLTSTIQLPRHLIYTHSIAKIVYACGLASSVSEGHRLVAQKSLYIGGHRHPVVTPMDPGHIFWSPISTWVVEQTKEFLIEGRLLVLRRGKANVKIVEVVDDYVYRSSGKSFPGLGPQFWDDFDAARKADQVVDMDGKKVMWSSLSSQKQEVSMTKKNKSWEKMQSAIENAKAAIRKQVLDPEDIDVVSDCSLMRPDHEYVGGQPVLKTRKPVLSKEEVREKRRERRKGITDTGGWGMESPRQMHRDMPEAKVDQRKKRKQERNREEFEQLMEARFGANWRQKIQKGEAGRDILDEVWRRANG